MKLLILSLILSLLSNQSLAEGNAINNYKVNKQSNHQIVLLNSGLASLEQRLQLIENARKSIEVEYFIYKTDKSGRIFSQALIKKALEGVKVRVLLDYFMIKSTFTAFNAYEMEKNGVEVKYFNTTATLNLGSGQYRNHRKLLLVDDEHLITGGRNIADEYFDFSTEFNFLDRDLLVSGEIVNSIKKTFDEFWNSKLSVKLERPLMPKINNGSYRKVKGGFDFGRFNADRNKYNKKVSDAVEFVSVQNVQELNDIRQKGKNLLASEYEGHCDNISFNSELPLIGQKNGSQRIIKFDLANRINNAKETILFDSPYFIVDDESRVSLENALSKNVNITLLTNSLYSTDAIPVFNVFTSLVKSWIKKGLNVHIFKGLKTEDYNISNDQISNARFGVHAKSFVFDNKDTIIGTYNFDPRSANLNSEMTIACNNNPELASHVSDDINKIIEESFNLKTDKIVDETRFYKTDLLKKMAYYVIKFPISFFEHLL